MGVKLGFSHYGKNTDLEGLRKNAEENISTYKG
jgi:hypothetical protein